MSWQTTSQKALVIDDPSVVFSNLWSKCHSWIPEIPIPSENSKIPDLAIFKTQMEENTTAMGYPVQDRTHTPMSAGGIEEVSARERTSASGGN